MTLGCYWIYTKCAAIAEVYTGRHNNCSLHLQPSGHSWAAHIMACISLQFTLSKWCINYKLVGSHCSDRCTYGDAFQLAPLSDFLILQLHLYIPNYRFCSRFNLSPLPRGGAQRKTFTSRFQWFRGGRTALSILYTIWLSLQNKTLFGGYGTMHKRKRGATQL